MAIGPMDVHLNGSQPSMSCSHSMRLIGPNSRDHSTTRDWNCHWWHFIRLQVAVVIERLLPGAEWLEVAFQIFPRTCDSDSSVISGIQLIAQLEPRYTVAAAPQCWCEIQQCRLKWHEVSRDIPNFQTHPHYTSRAIIMIFPWYPHHIAIMYICVCIYIYIYIATFGGWTP